MKNLILFAVFVVMGLIIGCQENQMTEPVSPLSKTEVLPSGQWIKLGSPVMDPLNGRCEIIGSVYCSLTEYIIVTDPTMAFKTASKYKLEIIFDAELCKRDLINEQPPNRIYGRTERKLQLTDGEVVTLVDTYDIENRENLVLVVKYGVSQRGVSVQQMYLREI